ncbi:hypothetical protein ACFWXK_21890 [Streptomyces sp. NPDC059070]|uniref:hypothetical protein n=1 Tax=unclassified Streptomyces TaxID=2593676 RepID=UPI0034E2C8E7
MRIRAISTAAAVAFAGTFLGLAPASPALAASPVFDYPVDPAEAPDIYRDIPGTDISFDAKAGERSYLWSRNLTTTALSALGPHENLGHTFAIRCSYADGTAFPEKVEAGAYWAANLVPPAEKSLTPGLRWMFTAPDDGRFTCKLSVVAYSTIIKNGRQVGMRIAAGAELGRLPVADGPRWTLPETSGTVVARGATATTLGYTVTPGAGQRTTIVQDANLTTCMAKSRICDGGTAAYTYTKAETWIEAQPQNADGALCGGPIKGPVAKWDITDDRHHQSATNTLNIDRDQLGGCTSVRTTLKVRNVDGNPVKIHAGTASGAIAATHGLAFTL